MPFLFLLYHPMHISSYPSSSLPAHPPRPPSQEISLHSVSVKTTILSLEKQRKISRRLYLLPLPFTFLPPPLFYPSVYHQLPLFTNTPLLTQSPEPNQGSSKQNHPNPLSNEKPEQLGTAQIRPL